MRNHTTGKPCLACRSLVKGNELEANGLYCDPSKGGCGHFHREKDCPEIVAPQVEPQTIDLMAALKESLRGGDRESINRAAVAPREQKAPA